MAIINVKFTTDQSGQATNVCSGTDVKFNFSLNNTTDTYNLAGAYIETSRGNGNTSTDISAILYSGPNGTGSQLAISTVSYSTISAAGYAVVPFLFTGVTLSPATSYSLVIRSSVSCNGSNPYSIKYKTFTVLNADTNNTLNTGYGISAVQHQLIL